MASWNFSNIGFLCKHNKEIIMQLFECLGVDFDNVFESVACSPSNRFRPVIMGSIIRKSFEISDLYHIVNKLFNNVFIYYEFEKGNNTSDYYYRREEIYDPLKEELLIRECDYAYGNMVVFGQSVYDILKDEMEERAKQNSIFIKWKRDFLLQPVGEEFINLCELIIDEHGGLPKIGTKDIVEKIPNNKLNRKLIQEIANIAGELVYILIY